MESLHYGTTLLNYYFVSIVYEGTETFIFTGIIVYTVNYKYNRGKKRYKN